jgi:hypothetical protein
MGYEKQTLIYVVFVMIMSIYITYSLIKKKK